MANNNILIAFSADTAGLDEANQKLVELKGHEKELISEIQKLQQVQKADVDAAKNEKERVRAVLDYEKAIVDTRKELTQTQKTIKDVSAAHKDLEKTIAAGNIEKSFRATRLALEEQLRVMRKNGEAGTEAYNNILAKLTELNVVQKQVTAELKTQSSATFAFDAILQGTQLAAGGYSVLTGAMSLFGSENKDVQQLMVKLQSVIAITTGLQQVQNATMKTGALMQGVMKVQMSARTAAEALSTKGTISATIAQKAFNIVANANPYVLLATALITVIGGLALFVLGSNEANSSAKNYTSSLDGMKFATKEAADAHDDILKQIRDLQIEIDLVNGKITEYQANLLKINNKTIDAFQEINDELKKEINDINEEYQGFFTIVGKSLSILWNEGKSLSFAEIEQRRIALIEEAEKRAAQKRQDRQALESKEQEKASADEVKRQISKYSSIAKEREQYEKNINDKLAEERLKAIKDDEAREVLAVKQQYDKKLEVIKGNSPAEIALRKQLEENAETDIQKIRDKYDTQRLQSQLQTELNISNSRLSTLKEGEKEYVKEKENNLRILAGMEAAAVMKSEATEEEKNSKLLAINNKLTADLDKIWGDYNQKKNIDTVEGFEKVAEEEILTVTKQYRQGLISLEQYERRKLEIILEAKKKELAFRKALGEDTTKLELQIAEAEISIKKDTVKEIIRYVEVSQEAISGLSGIFFDAQQDRLNQQLDNLNLYYTTDAEEAKKNKNLKLISEEELAKRQLEIKRKQAQADKNQAIFDIFLNQGIAIAKAFAQGGGLFGPALAAIVIATTAVQLAAVMARPLPKYWKGRKGGKGEYAMIGEQGPEMMWIPQGASIMPANDTRRAIAGDMSAMDKWRMPRIEPNYPAMPYISQKKMEQARKENQTEIDYDKLGMSVAKYNDYNKFGRAVAKHQKSVSVSFDKSGLSVTNGNRTTLHSNSKGNV